ncbi:MAG: PASTA domain-containing protein [Frankia sp.]|nr:PASTA domain-containing protein [Frankia sp.]
MGKDRTPWQTGRRAWDRLGTWRHDNASGRTAESDNGARALTALTDIGFLRRLLDEAELEAVRTARRTGKSWAEIATRLGMTRQSAWERWRDLDEPDRPPQVPAKGAGAPDGPEGLLADAARLAAAELAEQALRGLPPLDPSVITKLDRRERRRGRRQKLVPVPNVVGMTWAQASATLTEVFLIAVANDPDGPPSNTPVDPTAKVTAQAPETGARVPPGAFIRLWLDRGDGSAGVREPRRPIPPSIPARELRPEPTGRSDVATARAS